MTARDSGREDAPRPRQGLRFDRLTAEERARVLADAFDYRGDVTLLLDDGSAVAGYVFDVSPGPPDPHVKILPAEPDAPRRRVPLARISGCEFTGRDTADGRSWEAWVRRWDEKQRLLAQGVDIGDIEPKPPEL